jgi:PH (Pleckstrin Homology) domain-containing protein
MYVVLILIVAVLLPHSSDLLYLYGPWALGGLLVLFLARYVSTTYSLNDTFLSAWRIFGGRRVRLSEIRKIEFSNMRELGPTGGVFGSWGWRGRMWSPQLGRFDAIYTDATHGILVTVGEVPLFITPNDPTEFARELSRRVRSYTGRLLVDVGDPLGSTEESEK